MPGYSPTLDQYVILLEQCFNFVATIVCHWWFDTEESLGGPDMVEKKNETLCLVLGFLVLLKLSSQHYYMLMGPSRYKQCKMDLVIGYGLVCICGYTQLAVKFVIGINPITTIIVFVCNMAAFASYIGFVGYHLMKYKLISPLDDYVSFKSKCWIYHRNTLSFLTMVLPAFGNGAYARMVFQSSFYHMAIFMHSAGELGLICKDGISLEVEEEEEEEVEPTEEYYEELPAPRRRRAYSAH